MAEADSALRAEIEKVRERARLQVLSQGLDPEAAEIQADAAVEEFCARWGIRPEMLGPGLLRGARPAAAPVKEGPRKVDLGASSFRTSVNLSQTQAIRIGDLMKRAKEMEAAAAAPQASSPTALPSSPAFQQPPVSTGGPVSRNSANLTSLLRRMKTQGLPTTPSAAAAAATGPAAVPAAPPRPAAAPFRGPSAPAPAPPVPLPSMTRPAAATSSPGTMNMDPLGGGGTLSGNAERRRQIIDEFDRTYTEVQAMLEQRIGVVDIALNDASKGLSGVLAKAQAGGYDSQELEVLAVDVGRLHQNLQVMMELCQEFLEHVQTFSPAGGTGRGREGR